MKGIKLIATLLLVFCLGVFIGRYSCETRLRACNYDLAWAVRRGVTLEAHLILCRQGK